MGHNTNAGCPLLPGIVQAQEELVLLPAQLSIQVLGGGRKQGRTGSKPIVLELRKVNGITVQRARSRKTLFTP